jgi:hypothetical protein
MKRKPATMMGFFSRAAVLAVVVLVGARVLAGPIAFTKFGIVTVAVVLVPGIVLAVVQQIRLRRDHAAEKGDSSVS